MVMPACVDYDFRGVEKPCFGGQITSAEFRRMCGTNTQPQCTGGGCQWADCCNLGHRDPSLRQAGSPVSGRMPTGHSFAYPIK